MSNAEDLLNQVNILQQPSPPIEKKSNHSRWRIIFIPLLIINLLIGFWIIAIIYYAFTGPSASGMSLIVAIPALLILSIIDLIALLPYIFKGRPQGRAKFIVYAVLTVISIILILSGFLVSVWFQPRIQEIIRDKSL